MNAKDGEKRDAKAVMHGLGWPSDIPIERLAASVYDRAMRAGMFEAELILGYTFDRTEFPASATREDRLSVALNALCRFALHKDCLEELRHDGVLVPVETLDSDCWTAESPRLPCMQGLYEYASREWDQANADDQHM